MLAFWREVSPPYPARFFCPGAESDMSGANGSLPLLLAVGSVATKAVSFELTLAENLASLDLPGLKQQLAQL